MKKTNRLINIVLATSLIVGDIGCSSFYVSKKPYTQTIEDFREPSSEQSWANAFISLEGRIKKASDQKMKNRLIEFGLRRFNMWDEKAYYEGKKIGDYELAPSIASFLKIASENYSDKKIAGSLKGEVRKIYLDLANRASRIESYQYYTGLARQLE